MFTPGSWPPPPPPRDQVGPTTLGKPAPSGDLGHLVEEGGRSAAESPWLPAGEDLGHIGNRRLGFVLCVLGCPLVVSGALVRFLASFWGALRWPSSFWSPCACVPCLFGMQAWSCPATSGSSFCCGACPLWVPSCPSAGLVSLLVPSRWRSVRRTRFSACGPSSSGLRVFGGGLSAGVFRPSSLPCPALLCLGGCPSSRLPWSPTCSCSCSFWGLVARGVTCSGTLRFLPPSHLSLPALPRFSGWLVVCLPGVRLPFAPGGLSGLAPATWGACLPVWWSFCRLPSRPWCLPSLAVPRFVSSLPPGLGFLFSAGAWVFGVLCSSGEEYGVFFPPWCVRSSAPAVCLGLALPAWGAVTGCPSVFLGALVSWLRSPCRFGVWLAVSWPFFVAPALFSTPVLASVPGFVVSARPGSAPASPPAVLGFVVGRLVPLGLVDAVWSLWDCSQILSFFFEAAVLSLPASRLHLVVLWYVFHSPLVLLVTAMDMDC